MSVVRAYEDPHLTMWLGDVREVLAAMEPDSVQTVVTSPPYFGLRDYGVPPSVWDDRSDPLTHVHEWAVSVESAKESWTGRTRWNHATNGDGLTYTIDTTRTRVGMGSFCSCRAWLGTLGLEPTPDLYVDHVVDVFRSLRRVLRPDGTIWLNLGDSYADRANRRSDGESFRADRADVVPGKRNTIGGAYALKAKDRMMMPATVALALRADGWWLRDEIVWSKPNAMPSSVADRTTPAHEMVYLLTKRARYHYDGDAIREPAVADHRRTVDGSGAASNDPSAVPPGAANHRGLHRVRERGVGGRTDGFTRMPGGAGEWAEAGPAGRNKRSVWTIATQPYPEAHFATFPEKLVEPMILAGAPLGSVVLDPFGGSGTVAMVANRLGRRAVHIDLSAEYTEQALERIARARAEGDGPAVDMPVPFADDGLWAES